ncbi:MULTISPECIES: hypothetical protein [Candidatus Nitrosocaldus]|uniref:PEFG-CTERM sorting domain-containing protein n=1 Tax=Candidatus Nitrosocaldus cavascurensis TaxID=2058097 RepID=A0A2K5APZ4_9ARCH|nr:MULTISPECIES: hypothetical protein [Candidatus Nitrosocaldus]SPC33721.1 protein of unknown function [Candidatus Nitrosocaldus cavascurensis]
MWMVGIMLILLFTYTLPHNVYATVVEDKHVHLTSTVIKILGHLEQARENKSNGNDELAIAHAGHPASELFMLIRDDIADADQDLAEKIGSELESLPSNVPNMSSEELKSTVTHIHSLLNNVILNNNILPEEKRSDIRFWATVMLDVLEDAYEEYSEGVEVEGEVSNIIEWQDSIGFTSMMVEDLFPVMLKNRLDVDLSSAIESSLHELIKGMKDKISSERIGSIINSITDKLNGLTLKGEQNAPDIRRVRELLDLALKSYQAGKFEEEEEGEYSEALANYEKAKELVIKAYKENFEPLKSSIDTVDPSLMRDTEAMFYDLIGLIDGAKSVEEVKAKIEQLKDNVSKIMAVGVIPEFPMSVVVTLATITGIGVLMGRFKRLNS